MSGREIAQEKTMEQLPVLDWETASHMTGEEKDEAFVAELVENFCNEEQGGMTEIVDACKQFQNGTLTSAVEAGRKIYHVAHRIKGSAANIYLLRLTRGAMLLERQFKDLVEKEDEEKLSYLLKNPPKEILTLAEELDNLTKYVLEVLQPYAQKNLSDECEQETLDGLAAIQPTDYTNTVKELF